MKSILSLISVPGLKKLATFTSTSTLYNPKQPKRTSEIPENRTAFGYPITIELNLPINLSKILGLIIDLEFRSQFFKLISAGKKKELSSHAHAIPTEIQTPYPTKGSSGDEVIVINAAIVVILVKKIGTKRESIPFANASCTFF